MGMTIGEAARRTGRDRSTLRRQIKSGKLSAARDEATGAWMIEVAELERLHPLRLEADAGATPRPAPPDLATDALVAVLQRTVDDLRGERDRLLAIIEGQRLLPAPRRPWWRWKRAG
jgi:excisionase family DNA binding protein